MADRQFFNLVGFIASIVAFNFIAARSV